MLIGLILELNPIFGKKNYALWNLYLNENDLRSWYALLQTLEIIIEIQGLGF